MQYFDIHTHTPGLHPEDVAIISVDMRKVVDIYDHPGTEWIQKNESYSIGVHPWYIDGKDVLTINRLFANICELTLHPAVIAIGETGLDKITAKTTDDFQFQQELFISHVRLSEKVKKPLIIHCVKAWNELVQIREFLKPSMPWIIHGFRGKAPLATRLLNIGFYLSFGIHSNIDSLKVAWIKRQLLLETDDKNIDIRNVYQQVARDLNISEQDLSKEIEKCFANATRGS